VNILNPSNLILSLIYDFTLLIISIGWRRYLAHLKSHVSNKAQPEGSMAEGYILQETIAFCSTFLEGVETIFNRRKRNDDYNDNMHAYLFNSGGRVVGMENTCRLDDKSLSQAHRYVLLHSDDMKELIE